MNLSISFANLNTNTLLLLAGVFILLLNVLYGVIRVRRNQLKAGWFTVVVMVAACIMVGIGIVGFATEPRQASNNRFNRTGFGQTGGQVSTQNNFAQTGQIQNIDQTTAGQPNPADPQTTALPNENSSTGQGGNRFLANLPSAEQTMIANGQGPEVVQTLAASGTQIPPRVMTAVADGQFLTSGNAPANQVNSQSGSSGSTIQAPAGFAPPAGFELPANATNAPNTSTSSAGGGFQAPAGFAPPAGFESPAAASTGTEANGTGANGGNSATGQTTSFAIPANLVGNMLAGVGGVLVFFSGLYLYYYERRKPGFAANASRGLLNAGAGVFIVFSAIVVPTLPASISGSSTAARSQVVVNTTIEARVGVPTPTPTLAPPSTSLPTELPTLTPTPTDGPLVMATQIVYPHAQPTAASDCQVTTTALVNLRADPSTNNMAIGRVQPGSIVVVTDYAEDNQWLRVTYDDGSVVLDGWISAKYTTPLTGCSSLISLTETPVSSQ